MSLIAFDVGAVTEATGAIFGGESDDLDFTLVQWHAPGGVNEHVSGEVDVLMIVVGGEGVATVDGQAIALTAGKALLIPKSSKRRIDSLSPGFRYLNVHKRKKRLMPGSIEDRPRSGQ